MLISTSCSPCFWNLLASEKSPGGYRGVKEGEEESSPQCFIREPRFGGAFCRAASVRAAAAAKARDVTFTCPADPQSSGCPGQRKLPNVRRVNGYLRSVLGGGRGGEGRGSGGDEGCDPVLLLYWAGGGVMVYHSEGLLGLGFFVNSLFLGRFGRLGDTCVYVRIRCQGLGILLPV